MAQNVGNKCSGLSESEREYFLALKGEGVEVEDLMADDQPMGSEPEQQPSNPPTHAGKTNKKSGLRKEEREELIVDIVARLKTKPLKTKRADSHERAQTTAGLYLRVTGQRWSATFLASKLESYARITAVPKRKWVALAVQHLDERPTKVWTTHIRKLEREGKGETL
jgi:hypothetical protein